MDLGSPGVWREKDGPDINKPDAAIRHQSNTSRAFPLPGNPELSEILPNSPSVAGIQWTRSFVIREHGLPWIHSTEHREATGFEDRCEPALNPHQDVTDKRPAAGHFFMALTCGS